MLPTSLNRVTQHLRATGHMGAALVAHPAPLRTGVRPSWPVSPQTRERIQIRWPTEYEWSYADNWVGGLRASLAQLVRVSPAEIGQPFRGTVLIEVEIDGRPAEVAIDYHDRPRLLEEVVERCALVFKMQYSAGGYGYPHVVPGGYVPGRAHVLRYLPGVRRIKDHARPRFQVYGRFSLRYATETRHAALAMLTADPRFRFEGSFAIRPYAAYLREMALSSVCLDLPGNGDMCHRLIDYLAIGCCVVRPAPETELHVPLADGVDVRFAKRDLTDLADLCAELLSDDEQRQRLAQGARDHFDSYLDADQLAGYYIDRCMAVLTTA